MPSNTWQLQGVGRYAQAKELITGQFNSITMENQMEPDALISADTRQQTDDSAVVINTGALDEILRLASDSGQKLRGNCLVWDKQTPEWFFCSIGFVR